MSQTEIVIRGAREHNLRGVDLTLPRNAMITVTGVSGSGKSSLAFDTLFREGQRRFLESLSSYARQFVGGLEKPKVESVEGLSPTIAIDQKTVNRNPRSTVGTVTEVYDYLRLWFARLGTPHCIGCDRPLLAQTVDQMVDALFAEHAGERVQLLAPVVRERKGHYRKELESWARRGFVRARIDGEVRRLDEKITLGRYHRHTIELIVDRVRLEKDRRGRVAEALENAVRLADGQASVLLDGGAHREFSTQLGCAPCGLSLPEMEPRLFSFNSPQGACPECNGLGTVRRVDAERIVPDPAKSLAEGAIVCVTQSGYMPYLKLRPDDLEIVAETFGIDLNRPWRRLARKHRDVFLHGTERKVRFPVNRTSKNGRVQSKGVVERRLQGLVPGIEEAWQRGQPRHLEKYFAELPCAECEGSRLRPEARAVRDGELRIEDVVRWTVDEAREHFRALRLSAKRKQIGEGILREIRTRLEFLHAVGLSYLTLERSAATLSGGESQRVRLATQVGSGLQGVLYVLDEPSIGLHPRDHDRLLGTLGELRDKRNTVVVVEHDRDTMLAADWLVDVGPGAGELGGEIVASGPVAKVAEHPTSATARHLRGEETLPRPAQRRAGNGKELRIEGARHFNLKNLDVGVPLGRLVGVTGVSGSGKSTLVHWILHRALARELHSARETPGAFRRLRGIEHLDKVIEIDQRPIGRTPRSNPATYTKVWNHIRDLYAMTPEAQARGFGKGRFSFNVAGGRCESCQGAGVRRVEMQFLADVEVPCEECNGRRFNRETLEVLFRARNVHDVLEMSVREALTHFDAVPKVKKILQTLVDVGLDYLRLGQPSTTLSGGEAQRIKLASELARPATGRTLYLLDEPTTGLHFEDVRKLVATLERLVDAGNTVLVIEHNLDVIDACDHLIELGPEGGAGGGELVAEGTPEEVRKVTESATGKFLRRLRRKPRMPAGRRKRARSTAPRETLSVRGARKNNLQNLDVDLPHDALVVVTGPSGSGKTSLAFDTLYAEGQRRFVESLSTYARRFFSRLERAPVDRLDGIRPAIAIDQKGGVRSSRSTVATSTEIHDSFRILWSRAGTVHCPHCDRALRPWDASSAAAETARHGGRVRITAPLWRPHSERPLFLHEKRELLSLAPSLRADGFVRVLLDDAEERLDEGFESRVDDRLNDVQCIDLVVDRLRADGRTRTRLAEAFEEAFRRGHGSCHARFDHEVLDFCSRYRCEPCGFYFAEDLTPRHFSFNHQNGACPRCEGLGRTRRVVEERVVVRPDRALLRALKPAVARYYRGRRSFLRGALERAAQMHDIDLGVPFEELSKKQRAVLLRAEGLPERIESTVSRGRGGARRQVTWQMKFRGVLGEIERWIHESEGGKWWVDELLALTETGACPDCGGSRLRPESRAVRFADRRLEEIAALAVRDARPWFDGVELNGAEAAIAAQPLQEVRNRLRFLEDVGLGYLTLDRASATLSGGEAQRIRLAQQLGSGLVGVLYVLDEPSIGLHPRDTGRLIRSLTGLRDLGNTVVVVEHDEDTMLAADHLVDLGPGAGVQGGKLVSSGTPAEVMADERSLTGAFLARKRRIEPPVELRRPRSQVKVVGAALHNLRDLNVDFPVGCLTTVTGVSGSGKSTLVMEVLRESVRRSLRGEKLHGCRSLRGMKAIEQLVVIDQSPDRHDSVLGSRDLHQGLGPHPRGVCNDGRGQGQGLRQGSLLVQPGQRAVCRVSGSGSGLGGDALPVGFVGPVRELSWPPLRSRDALRPVQGPQHRRRSGDGGLRGTGAVREPSEDPAHPPSSGRCRPRLRSPRPIVHDALRWRSSEGQVGSRVGEAGGRVDAVSAGRTDHGPALHGRGEAHQRAEAIGGTRQHRRRDRTSAGRDRSGGLGDRPGTGRRRGGRHPGHGRPPGQMRRGRTVAHGAGAASSRRTGGAHEATPAATKSASAHGGERAMSDAGKPLWVQADRTLLFEVDHPAADEVQEFLPRFAELEKSPERFHTYRITPLSLWNAAAVGVSAEEILEFLGRLSRHPPPQNVVREVEDFLRRYGLLRLTKGDGFLRLDSEDRALLDDLASSSVLEAALLGRADDGAILLREESRGDVKLALLRVGYPVEDLAGYTPGAAHPFRFRATTRAGREFAPRRYQRRAADLFFAGGSERGGSGVVVLPCGAGKTVVAMTVMELLQSMTLVLTTNTVAVRQWKSELLDKSEIDEDEIGEYTGQRKEIRPITISTYQILTHRKKSVSPFTHFHLFDAMDWGLIVYDEVHLLPAPVFRATADLQARRRLGLTATLVREDKREEDVFSLIGPKRFDMPWRELEQDGWIATATCVEVRVPMPQETRLEYLSLPPRDRFRVASENPEKLEALRKILAMHRGDLVLVIGQYLDQIEGMAQAIEAPLITGKTPVRVREQLYREFREGSVPVLVVSKVGNFAIDLPDASVAVQVSGTFGSRQEEAQRLGRILRPKQGGAPATFYSLVSRDTREEEYAQKRQRYLTERGYSYRICEPLELEHGTALGSSSDTPHERGSPDQGASDGGRCGATREPD